MSSSEYSEVHPSTLIEPPKPVKSTKEGSREVRRASPTANHMHIHAFILFKFKAYTLAVFKNHRS